MQVLVKKKGADEYYLGQGQWTSKRHEAKVYETSMAALRDCSAQEQKTEIALTFPNPKMDVTVPCGGED